MTTQKLLNEKDIKAAIKAYLEAKEGGTVSNVSLSHDCPGPHSTPFDPGGTFSASVTMNEEQGK